MTTNSPLPSPHVLSEVKSSSHVTTTSPLVGVGAAGVGAVDMHVLALAMGSTPPSTPANEPVLPMHCVGTEWEEVQRILHEDKHEDPRNRTLKS